MQDCQPCTFWCGSLVNYSSVAVSIRGEWILSTIKHCRSLNFVLECRAKRHRYHHKRSSTCHCAQGGSIYPSPNLKVQIRVLYGYATNQGAGTVSVLKIPPKSLIKNIPVGVEPNGMVFRKYGL